MGAHSASSGKPGAFQSSRLIPIVALALLLGILGVGAYSVYDLLSGFSASVAPVVTEPSSTPPPVPPSTLRPKVSRMGDPDYSKVNAK